MQRLRLFVACLALAAVGFAHAAGAKWQKDFAKAQKLAQKTNRVMVVDFGAEW